MVVKVDPAIVATGRTLDRTKVWLVVCKGHKQFLTFMSKYVLAKKIIILEPFGQGGRQYVWLSKTPSRVLVLWKVVRPLQMSTMKSNILKSLYPFQNRA